MEVELLGHYADKVSSRPTSAPFKLEEAKREAKNSPEKDCCKRMRRHGFRMLAEDNGKG